MAWLGAAAMLASACSEQAPRDEPIAALATPIINGQLNTTHQAVVAVFHGSKSCSGTIFQVVGTTGYLLTAAHCVGSGFPQQITQGDDYQAGGTIDYPIVESVIHPYYNEQLYDFAVVKFSGASAQTPTIALVTPSDPLVTAGNQMRFVGYGLTSYPNGQNSLRREKVLPLAAVRALTLEYDQSTGGPCSGDSGGAVLTTDANERVAGVIANVVEGCVDFGTSGKVTAVYDAFIQTYVNNQPFVAGKDCAQCRQWATTGTGPCSGQVQACFNSPDCDAYVSCIQPCVTLACIDGCDQTHPSGSATYAGILSCVCDNGCASECDTDVSCNFNSSSSSSSSGGVGGASSSGAGGSSSAGVGGGSGSGDSGWNAGNLGDRDYDGEVLSSGCSVRSSSEEAPRHALGWLAVLWLAALRRRRRRLER